MVENMTKEQIEKEKEKIKDECKAKIVVYFSENGVGVDASETGASKSQVFQSILALLTTLSVEDIKTQISKIADYDKLLGLMRDFKEKFSSEGGKDGVQE